MPNPPRMSKTTRPARAAVADPALPLMRWLLAGLLAAALALAATAASARQTPDSFADLAEKLLPAVVNISTTQSVTMEDRPGVPHFPPGSPFEDFFEEFFNREQQQQAPRQATSLGSGFIIDPDGYVVTNNHVIAEAEEINVILHDDTVLSAEVVGRDEKTDLALLKVDAGKPLPYVQWGDSSAMRIGDWVLAIGNPFGLGGTVTAGIISARARDINAGPYDDFLQTDAAINRGNSGGPMFNLDGEVIGINTAIFSPSGGSIGIGFAIPSALAKGVIQDLMEYGRPRRGWLGVRIQSVTDEIAESLGLDKARGALVASVTEGGPAAKAGLRPGDVILRFDGRPVEEMRRLPRMVAETAIGKEVEVTVWRNGGREKMAVVLGELEEGERIMQAQEQRQWGPGSEQGGETDVPALGLTVAPITPELRDRFGIPAEVKGLAVTGVAPGGPAAEKGLEPGDVIVEVGQEPVTSPAELEKRVEAARDDGRRSVLLLVENEQGLRFTALRIDGDSKGG